MEKTYADLLQELAEALQVATNKATAAQAQGPSARDTTLLDGITLTLGGLSDKVSRMREYDSLRKR